MKTAMLLTMTALSGMLLAAGDFTRPADAAQRVRALTVKVKPQVKVRPNPKIKVRPRVVRPKVRIDTRTKRVVTKEQKKRTARGSNIAAGGPQSEPPTNPKQTMVTNAAKLDPVPLPREKPTRFAALDVGTVDTLRDVNEANRILMTLRELEIIKNVGLFGQEDGSVAGDHDRFTGGLAAGLPEDMKAATPPDAAEGAPEHAALFNSAIPQPGASGNPTPPSDGGTERHPGGNRPGQGHSPSPGTKVNLNGYNGPASNGSGNTSGSVTDANGGVTRWTLRPNGANSTYRWTPNPNDPTGTTGTHTSSTTFEASVAPGKVRTSFRWDINDDGGSHMTVRLYGRDDSYTETLIQIENGRVLSHTVTEYDADGNEISFREVDQPIPIDGAEGNIEMSTLCGTTLPSWVCARGAKGSASPEDMTRACRDYSDSRHRPSSLLRRVFFPKPVPTFGRHALVSRMIPITKAVRMAVVPS